MNLFTKVTVFEGYAGLHFQNGKLEGILLPGTYRYFGPDHRVIMVNMRPRPEVIGAQEVVTSDGGSFRISVVIVFQIGDAELNYRSGHGEPTTDSSVLSAVQTYGQSSRLHQLVQIGVREWVMSRTFKGAFEDRVSLASEILPNITTAAAEFGVKVTSLELLDFTMVGSLRTAYADLLKTEIEGQTALARARNESSTMRSLLNTARLVNEHPGLLELRVLSSGQKPRVTFVVGNDQNGTKAATQVEPAQ